MQPILLIAILSGATVLLLAYGLYQFATRRRTILADRVRTYAGVEAEAAQIAEQELGKQSPVARLINTLIGRGYIDNVESNLAQADLPLRASEYILMRVVVMGLGLIVGLYAIGNLRSGLILALLALLLPPAYVHFKQNQRRAKFVRQLADALMLLTNSLRSGYSFLKGLELVAKEMDDPISKELSRTLREVSLGATIDEALTNLGRRVNSPDLDIVISAFLVQKEVGGNLTEIMQKVAETIRERLRIQGDIRVLTAQGRISGLIVGLLPVVVFLFIYMKSQDYFTILFDDPKWHFQWDLFGAVLVDQHIPYGVLLLMGAACWQLLGGYIIYKIVSIKA
jgi:tight adherence protein B